MLERGKRLRPLTGGAHSLHRLVVPEDGYDAGVKKPVAVQRSGRSPKTVSRWAKEGKLPFLKTLGGDRRYPAAKIGQLADELQVRPTA